MKVIHFRLLFEEGDSKKATFCWLSKYGETLSESDEAIKFVRHLSLHRLLSLVYNGYRATSLTNDSIKLKVVSYKLIFSLEEKSHPF